MIYFIYLMTFTADLIGSYRGRDCDRVERLLREGRTSVRKESKETKRTIRNNAHPRRRRTVPIPAGRLFVQIAPCSWGRL
jgi:hypothetical protein